MGKLVFLDIDGTIRNFDGYIPDSAVRAIRAARKNGHKVCICTGRPRCQVDKRVLDIGFDGVVSGAGSYVEFEGECIHYEYFPEEDGMELIRFLLEQDCVIEFQKYDHSYVLKDQMQAYLGVGDRIEAGIARAIPEEERKNKPEKLIGFIETADSLDAVGKVEKMLYFSDHVTTEMIREKFDKTVNVVSLSIPINGLIGGELMPASVDKSEGICRILRFGGYRQKDVIAVGDSGNDIGMLQMAGVGVAMGNATEEARQAADMITTSLKEDGLWNAFQKLGLLEP